MEKTNDSRKYIPVALRQDIIFPRFLDNIYGTPLSDSSQESDYYKDEEFNLIKYNAQYKRRGGIFNFEQLGVDQQQIQQLSIEITDKKNQLSKILKQNDSLKLNNDFNNILDIQLDSKKKGKKKKPKKKFDEDEIHNFSDEKLKEFIQYKFIDEYTNEKQEDVRKIIIMFKHPHLLINALTVKEFYLPIYKDSIIKDKKNAFQEFEDWRDYALKYILVRGTQGDIVHLSNGIRVEHFGQIPKQHNILIFGPSRILSFWHEFQKFYGFQLTFDQQKDFVYDLNCCQTKQEVYSSLVSLTKIQNTLLKREKQRMIKREEIKQINQEKRKNSLNNRKKTQSQSSIYQLEDDFKFLKFKKLSVNTYIEDQQSKDYLLEKQLQTEKRLKQIEIKVQDQISKSCKNIFRKQKFQFSNRIKPYTTFDQGRKKPNQLKNFQITFSKLPEIKKSQTIPNLKVQNSKKLIDLYSHYTSVLRTHVLSDNSKKSFNFGSIMKSFNGVRMKIMQQSLPRVAQIKKQQNQSQLEDTSILSKNKRYNQGNTIGWIESHININEMADFSLNTNK